VINSNFISLFSLYLSLLKRQINLILKRAAENYSAMTKGKEANWEVVERMLFIYAKLNPGQGMLKILQRGEISITTFHTIP
jgi:hypothetical protein